jgi:hypothetical protein
MVIDDRIIRAARCDLNERVFVSRDVERSAKSAPDQEVGPLAR